MKVLFRYYGLFSYHIALQQFLVILPFLLQQPTGSAFQYAHSHHHGLATPGYFHEELSLHWDDLELQLLSKVSGPSLHSNGFHVINATFPARQTSYIMHLSRTEGLFHPEQLGISANDATHLQCIYSGTVSEVSNGVYSQSGTVSLSTCHHEFGFEGLVLLPQEQYYIRPTEINHHHNQHHQVYSKFVKRSTNTPSVPHKAYKVNSPGGPYSKEKVDEVLRVPPEELLQASKNQSGNLDTLEDEDSTASVSPNTGNDFDGDNSILETPFIEGDDDCGNKGNCKNSLPPVMATLSKGKQAKNKKAQAKTVTKSGKGQVVEIAVFTDAKLYKTWQTRYPKNTMAKMNQYVLAVINNMNALYKQPSMTENINFRLVHLDIETHQPGTLNPHKGHATEYLKSFCGYAKEKNQYGRLWDHALLLTGYDMHEKGSNGTAGIAWFSTMCINGLSCSVIEGYTFGSAFITTHEIGHSLGMEHDGSGPNKGCDSNSYIMSPTTGGGKTDWSKCSTKNMRDFIHKGYMGNPSPTCITKKSAKAGNAIKFSSSKMPGQQFNANEQCTAECKGCTPYSTKSAPYNDICHLLFCQESKGYYSLIRSTHPALEGTTCAKGKVCRIGKCQ